MYVCVYFFISDFFQINHLKICHADLRQICRVRMAVDDQSKLSLKSLNGRCRGNQSSQNDSGSKERHKFRIGPRRRQQEAQLSPSDRSMGLVSSNLANYHATMQKLLIQVLTKPMVWSWKFSWRQCVIIKPTKVELCISPVYRRLAVAKFSKSTMQKLLTWPWPRPLRKHSLITLHGRPVYKIWSLQH